MKFASATDRGCVRPQNEDALLVEEANINGQPVFCFAIADGMGGMVDGELASQQTIHHLQKRWQVFWEDMSEKPQHYIIRLIEEANRSLFDLGKRTNKDMGTTLSFVTIHQDKAYIGHVGDCRVYLFRDSKLKQITHDHTYVQELIKKGLLEEEEAIFHPDRHMITRYIGSSEKVQVDFHEINLQQDDILLLSSDGLYSMVNEELLNHYLKMSNSLDELINKLILLANQMGGKDNISIILVQID